MKKESKDIVIYKQDIMDDDGKLNKLGALLLIGMACICFNKALNFYKNLL